MAATVGTVHVLHVDDEPEFAELVATFLEREDDRLAVRTAESATEGLELLADHEVDCIVSDYDMPGRNGIEFLDAVRDRAPDLPFILYTGKGSEAVASDAISAGVTDYLQKGSGTEQYELLANRITNAVEATQSRRILEERTRRLETLISNLPGVVYRCRNEPGWPMEVVEGEVEALTGYTATELEENEVNWGEEVLHPEDRLPVWEEVQESLEADDTFEVVYRILARDGTIKWMWERGRLVEMVDGDEPVLEGFITEITDRKEREQERKRQNDRLEEFASVVSHDLRTPLETAEGRLELARESPDSEHLDGIGTALDRMRDIVDDVLWLAREGREVGSIERVDLREAVESAWTIAADGASGAEMVVAGDGTLPTVEADREQLRQALENLFRNAVEHGRGALTVTVGELDDGFYVEDDGPGIEAEYRDRVFDDGYSTSEEGTGFGLSIVEQVVEAHGWEIGVTDGPEGGARFEVTGVTVTEQ